MTAMAWILIAMVVALVAAYAFMPKPDQPKQSLGELSVPTIEDGRDVTDIAGTVWISSPNILWYGDLRTTPITATSGK